MSPVLYDQKVQSWRGGVMEHPVIGLDLGVTASSELAVASGSGIESTSRVASTPGALTEGMRAAANGRRVAVVIESTAMSWFVAAVAALRSGIDHTLYRVSGTKAAALRAFYRAHTKTDRIDARVLARMPAVDEWLREFTLPEPSELALKRLVVLRHKLTVEVTKTQNRIRSTLHWAAPGLVATAGGDVSQALLTVLKRWPDLRHLARARTGTVAREARWQPGRAQRVITAAGEAVCFYGELVDFTAIALEVEVACAQIDALQQQIARLEARIAQLHQTRHANDVLLTIPGVGAVVAGVVRAVVGDMSRFSNLASLRAYTGLVPRESSSGEAKRRGRISKAGPSVLRWALYLAADVARQWDPQLADLYRRLMVERDRTHTQALCAVASHLVGRMWAVVKENRPYEWRDLAGRPIGRDQAHTQAQLLKVDRRTRVRLRSRREYEPGASRSRQPEAPQDATRLDDNLIHAALRVAGSKVTSA
jgi:transposase